jgi:twitching motility protein PilT
MEILFNTHAVASAIRSGKMESMDNVIVTSRADGMQSLDQSIKGLLKAHRISRETAERFITPGTKL